MNTAFTIARKEFVDTIRDKRTLLTMIVIPLAVMPLLVGGLIRFMASQTKKAESETNKVAVIGREYAPVLYGHLLADSLLEIRTDVRAADIDSLIQNDSLEGAVVIPPEFETRIGSDQQASVTLFFKGSDQLNVARRRMGDAVEAYDDEIVGGRIRRLNLDENLFDAIEVIEADVSSIQERLGSAIGGFLPYIFIILAFTGSMYPGIDLAAGEKERGTLETILSSPASRLDIVLGKFVVVTTVGFMSGILSILGLYLAVRSMGAEIPQEFLDVVFDILSFKVVAMVASLLLPVAAFFSAVILAVSIYAKSFKEAQSYLTPLSIVVIVPVALGMLPGIELTAVTALIPILNVSLATKEVIAGTIDPVLLALCYVSLFAIAAGAIAFCVAWFNRESALFRT